MNPVTIVAYLLSKVTWVVDFFDNLFPGTKNTVTNVFSWIDTARLQALSQSILNTTISVSNAKTVITSAYTFVDNILHGRIDRAYVDLTVLFNQGLSAANTYLQDLITRVDGESLTRVTALHDVVNGLYQETTTVLHNLGINLNQRIDVIELEFNQIIHSVGLSLEEKRQLLGMFLNDPLGFIASVFFEIAIPILLYEAARALSEASTDIGPPPNFSGVQLALGDDSLPSAASVGQVTVPVNKTSICGYSFNPYTHPGVDLEAYVGKRVHAAHDGIVNQVEIEGWKFGNSVRIEGHPFSSYYGHLSVIEVQEGQEVKAGEVIGIVGDSGQASAVFLYFELYLYGVAVNPFNYFRS